MRNLQDAKELSHYDNLRWAHHSDDGTIHREFLAVPIFDASDRVVGVIRMSLCDRPGGFSLIDEVAAQAAAKEIGRVSRTPFEVANNATLASPFEARISPFGCLN